MRLISAQIRGVGRLVNCKVNLDSKLIAVVGPNEAGKSTLLEALVHLNTNSAIATRRRARATSVTDSTDATTLTFQLDDSDHAAMASLDLEELPTRVTIARSMSGEVLTISPEPRPRKRRAGLEAALEILRGSAADRTSWESALSDATVWGDPGGDGARDFRSDLDEVVVAAELALNGEPVDAEAEAVGLAERMTEALDPEATDLARSLGDFASWVRAPEPDAPVRDILWNRTPDFLLFGDDDRNLASSYGFDAELAANPPAALSNLAATAGLDLPDLARFIEADDITRRQTALRQANRKLEGAFRGAWNQSELAVRLDVDGDLLRVQLEENSGVVTVFDERSAGLRIFVALVCFLAIRDSIVPPILLVDEAENHLHLDAQADLVNMFVTQQQATKVIYTTHSPACLPPDLGTGIRAVVPTATPSESEIRNSFWNGSAGYSPLLMAMGAAAAAFVPTRLVVLAEGATEMILLPSLLRAALGVTELQYQVAPGLSEISNVLLGSLDLEAARVAYLVDGDKGGKAIAANLRKAGVAGNLICTTPVAGVEELVEPVSLRDAYTALVPECNPAASVDGLILPSSSPSAAYNQLLVNSVEAFGLLPPSKVAVANWLVQQGRATSTADQAAMLIELNTRLEAALRLDK